MLSFLAMAHFLIPSGPILLEARIGPENGVVGSVGRPPRDSPPHSRRAITLDQLSFQRVLFVCYAR